ncbi:hypothetical protein A8B82_01665 [Sulfitobacter sp. EhC04]|nr:hypothetical protein A8B82_01665 [Sulfitobacter sp. EhC04]
MKIRIKKLCALALTTLMAAGVANAETRTLVIASWAAPTHVFNQRMWPDFIKKLEEVSDGELTAEVKLNLVPPPAMADLVADGAADITFIFHGYNAGRFVTTQLVELPGVAGDAEATSVAYWRVWDKYLKAAGEQDEFKTIGMFMHGAAQIHTAEPIQSLADLNGMKVRSPGGVGSMIVDELGGIGIQVPGTKVYETLAARAADGVVMNVEARTSFNLDEVAPAVFLYPGGLYRGSFAALMNKETWDSFSPELQAKLDKGLFGEPMSRLFGKLWAEGDMSALENSRAAGLPIIEATDKDVELFNPIIEKISANIIDVVNAKGIDAVAAQKDFADITAEIMKETSR